MTEANAKAKRPRRLKNAQTIREQAMKAQEAAALGRPAKTQRLKSASRRAGRPLKHFGKVLRFKPLRWVSLVLVPPFLRSSWRELRLVTWPNRRESRQLTTAVIIFSIIFGLLVWGVDVGLNDLFKRLILK